MNFSVRAMSTANGAAADFDSGSVTDGVTLATHDVICLKDQTQGIDNGFFIVQPTGTALMVRHPAAEKGMLLPSGTNVEVREGTANGGKLFFVSTADPIIIGKTSIAFAEPVVSTSISDNAVSNARLRDSAAVSVVGRSVNSTGDPADIAAAADGDILRRAAAALGFGTVLLSSVLVAIASKSANYTAVTTDGVILCTAGAGGFTVTLYAAAGNAGRALVVKKVDAGVGTITVDANGAETIDGALTQAIVTQFGTMTLLCDGSNWHRLSVI